MEPRLHRAEREAHRGRDLLQRQVEVVVEQHRQAELIAEVGQRPGQRQRLVARADRGGGHVGQLQGAGRAVAAVRGGDVGGQAPEPRLEGPLGVVAVEVAIEADEHLLGQVLRLVGVVQVLVGQGVDPPLVALDEALERVQVAAPGGARQRVGARLLSRVRAQGRQGPISLHRQELHARTGFGCYPPC